MGHRVRGQEDSNATADLGTHSLTHRDTRAPGAPAPHPMNYKSQQAVGCGPGPRGEERSLPEESVLRGGIPIAGWALRLWRSESSVPHRPGSLLLPPNKAGTSGEGRGGWGLGPVTWEAHRAPPRRLLRLLERTPFSWRAEQPQPRGRTKPVRVL